MNKYKMLKFNQLGDERGHLVVAESMNEIPFNIKRIFYIYETEKGVTRGQHANRNSRFVLINLRGSCKVRIDDGQDQKIVILNEPHKGVFLDRMVWKDMYDFSEDSLLLVLSDEHYDRTEYIRNYDEFIKEVTNRG